jgi:glycerophosphoryl diester phosphodiesterase
MPQGFPDCILPAGSAESKRQRLTAFLETLFLELADRFTSKRPYPSVSREQLSTCKIVSHRGEWINGGLIENTLAAFEAALDGGVWGLEFDIRWTRDQVPVVSHDPDLSRLFGAPDTISGLTFAQLRRRFPDIPSLEEMVERFGRRCHLMIELKEEPFPDPLGQERILADCLAPLTPVCDFHLMSLNPAVFSVFEVAPRDAMLPIARLQTRRFSRLALSSRFGGLTGHYLLLSRRLVRRHHRHGQRVGTGFIASVSCLHRELNREVDWLFTNRGAALQRYVAGVIDRC